MTWLLDKVLGAFLGKTLSEIRQGLLWWFAMRRARKLGRLEERAAAMERARQAEQEMAGIAAENRSTAETARRLNDQTF